MAQKVRSALEYWYLVCSKPFNKIILTLNFEYLNFDSVFGNMIMLSKLSGFLFLEKNFKGFRKKNANAGV
jgi:hypothetical protein